MPFNKENLPLLSQASKIDIDRLRELQSGDSEPTLEETRLLAKTLLDVDFDELYALAGIPPAKKR